jgi:hypothetical protein
MEGPATKRHASNLYWTSDIHQISPEGSLYDDRISTLSDVAFWNDAFPYSLEVPDMSYIASSPVAAWPTPYGKIKRGTQNSFCSAGTENCTLYVCRFHDLVQILQITCLATSFQTLVIIALKFGS